MKNTKQRQASALAAGLSTKGLAHRRATQPHRDKKREDRVKPLVDPVAEAKKDEG